MQLQANNSFMDMKFKSECVVHILIQHTLNKTVVIHVSVLNVRTEVLIKDSSKLY